jgi:hypothetical protein
MTPTLAALALATLWCLAWAPFFWCCCAPAECTTTVNVRVQGCLTSGSVWLSGLTVSIKIGGTTVATGTTLGSSSYVAISVTAATGAAATVEISGFATGYAHTPVAITLNCSSVTVSTSLGLITGYRCCTSPCCPQAGNPPYPVVAWDSTATVNDGVGNITLTKVIDNDDGFCTVVYRGVALRSASDAVRCSDNTIVAGDIYIAFSLSCDGDGVWRIAIATFTCSGDNIACYERTSASTRYYYGGIATGGAPTLPWGADITPANACVLSRPADAGIDPTPCEINSVALDFTFDFEYESSPGITRREQFYWVYGGTLTMSASI